MHQNETQTRVDKTGITSRFPPIGVLTYPGCR